ncbi:MAG TPA: MarR family transcriptional regulator [Actinomycetota bacterium]|nr:MarR family transcriptional regulator [Actinomycetota bacterium]
MREVGRDNSASRVVVSVLRAESRAAQMLERALAPADLSLPQFNVLMVLAATPGGELPLYELNAQLVSSAPNMSWISNRMEERGLVRKKRDDDDRRVVLIALTESGWKGLAGAAPLVFEAERQLVAGFSRAELTTLGNLLGGLLDGR